MGTDTNQKPTLRLVGEDGNAFAILGAARKAWLRAGLALEAWDEIQAEATSGDYDHLLQTMMRHFDVA